MGTTTDSTLHLLNPKTLGDPEQCPPGKMINDGGGLWLDVVKGGRRRAVYRYAGKKPLPLGCYVRWGTYQEARDSLRLVRERAREKRVERESGLDPWDEQAKRELAARLRETKAVTWKKAAQAYIASHKAGWRSEKHASQWKITLESTYPLMGDLPVSAIDTPIIVQVLAPIWTVKPITASRLRGRIEAVLDYARVMQWRPPGPNPAIWRGNLALAFPKPRKIRAKQHLAAIPFDRVPELMQTLAGQRGIAAKALRFTIMTGARSIEARGSTWDEFDLDAEIPAWRIPGTRMKAGVDHNVPLAPQVVELLRSIRPEHPTKGQLVFPSFKGKALSDMGMIMQLRSAGFDGCTVHGARSAFKDWARKRTSYRDELSELALAHTVGGEVRNAYARDDLFEERFPLMKDWAAHCTKPPRKAEIHTLASATA